VKQCLPKSKSGIDGGDGYVYACPITCPTNSECPPLSTVECSKNINCLAADMMGPDSGAKCYQRHVISVRVAKSFAYKE